MQVCHPDTPALAAEVNDASRCMSMKTATHLTKKSGDVTMNQAVAIIIRPKSILETTPIFLLTHVKHHITTEMIVHRNHTNLANCSLSLIYM
ncbi:MAG TPA: hypothetical protein DDX33_05625 [Rikenellaceae bacterium]|nr:hypothetical protein [Rikenellaceae bacterium]